MTTTTHDKDGERRQFADAETAAVVVSSGDSSTLFPRGQSKAVSRRPSSPVMKVFLGAAVAAVAGAVVSGAPAGDAVPALPSFGAPPSAQYSGFLNASAAEDGTHLHYW